MTNVKGYKVFVTPELKHPCNMKTGTFKFASWQHLWYFLKGWAGRKPGSVAEMFWRQLISNNIAPWRQSFQIEVLHVSKEECIRQQMLMMLEQSGFDVEQLPTEPPSKDASPKNTLH